MRYMIHACPAREWYVRGFLIPSMTKQGIPEDDITVWMDSTGAGNLASCIASFASCSQKDGETWHLQDDVVICRDFVERTRAAPDGIVCGFCVDCFEYEDAQDGETIARFMWQSSFPCIKIPNSIAGEFVEWFRNEASQRRDDLAEYVTSNKKDDTLFYIFMLEHHFNMRVTNLVPHLVEHVDWLIGGSTINQYRGFVARAKYWQDENLILELSEKLASRM